MPRAGAVRFGDGLHDQPFMICWHGMERQEYEYIVEPGTLNYMLEVPVVAARERGWQIPPPRIINLDKRQIAFYVQSFEAFLNTTKAENQIAPNCSGDFLLDALELIAEQSVFMGRSGAFSCATGHKNRSLVRRVECYLKEAKPDLLISGEDLSRAVDVSRRTLYAAFAQELGVGPKQFHDLVKLHRLRASLIASEFNRGSVSQLMQEQGFSHFGRTSGRYFRCFGETPIETLARVTK